MTHAYLTNLGAAELRVEIADAKDRLEQVLGRRVNHFSCPGGRWRPEIARAAREAGYRSVCTSRIGTNTTDSDPYALNRVAVLRRMPAFMELCQGRRLGMMRLKQSVRSALRSVVGESKYEKIRAVLLR